jgi:predicted  nucleic acid-binding Zn-ribbon protein
MAKDESVELDDLVDKLRKARERLTQQITAPQPARTRARRSVLRRMADLEQFIRRIEALRLQSELQQKMNGAVH